MLFCSSSKGFTASGYDQADGRRAGVLRSLAEEHHRPLRSACFFALFSQGDGNWNNVELGRQHLPEMILFLLFWSTLLETAKRQWPLGWLRVRWPRVDTRQQAMGRGHSSCRDGYMPAGSRFQYLQIQALSPRNLCGEALRLP